MARNRAPGSMQVNGAALLIKNSETSDALFERWQRVPGMSNFTLPDETGSTNETQLMDGAVSFAQIAGVGTITASIGAITAHATHRYLAERRRDGKAIQATIIRPAVDLGKIAGTGGKVGSAAIANGQSIVTVDAGDAALAAFNALREGTRVALADDDSTDSTKIAANPTWHGVVAVNPKPEATEAFKFSIEPGSAAVNKGAAVFLWARRAGILYQNIVCTVNGFGDGDFQAGAAVAANLSLAPAEALPTMTPENRLLSELGAGDFNGVFAKIT